MKMYYLKNKNTGEIVDVIASTLFSAKLKAMRFLGGETGDYIERFQEVLTMKPLTEELKHSLILSHNRMNTKPVKWDAIFDDEAELLQALFNPKVYTSKDKVPMHKWCKGYAYIEGFRKYYDKNGKLTDKQMTQLKRLASEIAYQIYCK